MFAIGQLSHCTEVKVPTIRYYEQVGLINPPGRTEGNQRRYGQDDLERLLFIRHARDLGLSLEDIKELVTLNANPEQPCADAHLIATRHLTHIQGRLKRLKKLEKELKRIVSGADSGHAGCCNVINALADHGQCETEHK